MFIVLLYLVVLLCFHLWNNTVFIYCIGQT